MDMQGALRARIVGASTTAGSRVYWVDRPQAAALPAVTLQTVSDPRPQHLKGFNPLRETRVQIDSWGDTYAAAKTLMEAVLAAVVPENTANGIRFDRALVDNSDDGGERTETKFIHRQRADLIFWWAAA
jgi:hypothetical protein